MRQVRYLFSNECEGGLVAVEKLEEGMRERGGWAERSSEGYFVDILSNG